MTTASSKTPAARAASPAKIISISAGDAAFLFKEARKNLLLIDETPKPTVLPGEIYTNIITKTVANYDQRTDWAINGVFYTVQRLMSCTMTHFPEQEPDAEKVEATLSTTGRFSPSPHAQRMAQSCIRIYESLQDYGLSGEDIMNPETVLQVRPRSALETIMRFRAGESPMEAAWNAYVFERHDIHAFAPRNQW